MEQHGRTVWHSVIEKCGMIWWNSETVWWNGVVEQWNSVAECGGTVWNSMVEQ